MNKALFAREWKSSWKLLILFAAVLSMYISMIIWMYDRFWLGPSGSLKS